VLDRPFSDLVWLLEHCIAWNILRWFDLGNEETLLVLVSGWDGEDQGAQQVHGPDLN
jgi:hypothetical protein